MDLVIYGALVQNKDEELKTFDILGIYAMVLREYRMGDYTRRL